jgi:hypothetical protein
MNNKVYINQTKAIRVVEHDTGSYNTLEVGFDGFEVDKTAIQNWLSNNGYTSAYLHTIYDSDDTVLCEETTAANRFELRDLGTINASVFLNVANAYKYPFNTPYSWKDDLYIAFVYKPGAGNRGTFLQLNQTSNFDALIRILDSIRFRPTNGNRRSLSQPPSNLINLIEMEWDSANKEFRGYINGNQLGEYIGSDSVTNYTASVDIEALSWRPSNGLLYEIAFSNSLENKEKVRAYIENEYNINIHRH